jgi:hypothetical protein
VRALAPLTLISPPVQPNISFEPLAIHRHVCASSSAYQRFTARAMLSVSLPNDADMKYLKGALQVGNCGTQTTGAPVMVGNYERHWFITWSVTQRQTRINLATPGHVVCRGQGVVLKDTTSNHSACSDVQRFTVPASLGGNIDRKHFFQV